MAKLQVGDKVFIVRFRPNSGADAAMELLRLNREVGTVIDAQNDRIVAEFTSGGSFGLFADEVADALWLKIKPDFPVSRGQRVLDAVAQQADEIIEAFWVLQNNPQADIPEFLSRIQYADDVIVALRSRAIGD